jgi:ATP-binding cassette, subfamily B, bacterial
VQRRRQSDGPDPAVTSVLARAVRARLEIVRLIPKAGIALAAGLTALNVVLGLLPVVFVVATSLLLGHVPPAVRGGAGSPAWHTLMSSFAVAAAAFVAQQLLAPAQVALGELMTRRVDGKVVMLLMRASLRTPSVDPLEDPDLLDQLSDARRELESDYQSPGRACAGLLALIARYTQLAAYAVVVAAAFSWLLAAALVGAVMVLRHGQRGGLRKYSRVFLLVAADRRRSDYLRELAIGAPAGKEIRVFGLIQWLRARYRREHLGWLMQVWAERRRIYLRPFVWFTGIALLVVAAVFAAVGPAAAASLSPTRLALVLQATLAALRLGDYYPEADEQTQFGMNAYDAARSVDVSTRALSRHTGLDSPPVRWSRPRVAIRFDHVAFGYPTANRLVFDQLDLTIPVGRSTAIVGFNGAGKTTLIKLLARLHEPTTGSVRVDGVDIRHLPVDEWRRHLAVVYQDHVRYELSAADNIGFGAVAHRGDRAGIRDAAAAAGILPVLDALPRGLDSPLARHLDGGADLSGGEWQRVAIARALFALRHGASILVLDEPTASLDARAEARFYEDIVRLNAAGTTILISHRFSTVRFADNILVLDQGQVVEQGTHDELLRLDGRYARLFRLQAARFREDVRVVR